MDKDDYNYISPGLAEWPIASGCKPDGDTPTVVRIHHPGPNKFAPVV